MRESGKNGRKRRARRFRCLLERKDGYDCDFGAARVSACAVLCVFRACGGSGGPLPGRGGADGFDGASGDPGGLLVLFQGSGFAGISEEGRGAGVAPGRGARAESLAFRSGGRSRDCGKPGLYLASELAAAGGGTFKRGPGKPFVQRVDHPFTLLRIFGAPGGGAGVSGTAVRKSAADASKMASGDSGSGGLWDFPRKSASVLLRVSHGDFAEPFLRTPERAGRPGALPHGGQSGGAFDGITRTICLS